MQIPYQIRVEPDLKPRKLSEDQSRTPHIADAELHAR